jgi:hypothetical protein
MPPIHTHFGRAALLCTLGLLAASGAYAQNKNNTWLTTNM